MESIRISDGIFEKTYDKKIVVIESINRNTTIFSGTNEFAIKLSAPLRDVVAIKPLAIQIESASNNLTAGNVYVDINRWQHTLVDKYDPTGYDNISSMSAFARVKVTTGGADVTYNSGITTLGIDPDTFVFDPVESTLRRFDVRLLKTDGTLFDTKGNNVTIVLAVYMKREKFSRI